MLKATQAVQRKPLVTVLEEAAAQLGVLVVKVQAVQATEVKEDKTNLATAQEDPLTVVSLPQSI